jgi:carbamoyltransferase
MKTLGIKLTHDAGIACIKGDRLIWALEFEKYKNGKRYAKYENLYDLTEHISSIDRLDSFDAVSIDGWKDGYCWNGIRMANYFDGDKSIDSFLGLQAKSYSHIKNHINSSVMFNNMGTDQYCIIWDGGCFPRLYKSSKSGIKFLRPLHYINGNIYGIMRYYWGPFSEQWAKDGEIVQSGPKILGGYSAPGKLMGWIGLGSILPQVIEICKVAYVSAYSSRKEGTKYFHDDYGKKEHLFCRLVSTETKYLKEEDVCASVHHFLSHLTASAIKLNEKDIITASGGCFLNIKMNSIIRSMYEKFWVSPFPNDSGSAIGAAASLSRENGIHSINWSIFSGHEIIEDSDMAGWSKEDYCKEKLSRYIIDQNIVCHIRGKAEVGPRALGARSLICDARSIRMKESLNDIKKREDWRPVSPMVAFDANVDHFSLNGSFDPFMIFDHVISDIDNHPFKATIHIDGTARLQTVFADNPVYELIKQFEKDTGLACLCNTSANESGCGFFDRTSNAKHWCEKNRVNFIATDKFIYKRTANCET